MNNLTVVEIEQQYHQLAGKGAYADALALATREAHKFSYNAQKIVYYWRFRMAALLKNGDLALQLMSEAVADGHWYSGLAEDEDFDLLHGRSEFDDLVRVCGERRAQAMATAVPVLKTLQPSTQPPPYPLLLALHGNNSRMEAFSGHWETAVSHGYLVGLPQSSQHYEPNTVSWVDWDWSIIEVQQHCQALCTDYPTDLSRIVLAGFSMGGGLATSLALSGKIKAKGLLLISPFLSSADNMIPYLEKRSQDGLRAYLVASERDQYCLGIARRLAELMSQYGIPCQLEIYPDGGHSFPPQFESKLPQALDFLMQE